MNRSNRMAALALAATLGALGVLSLGAAADAHAQAVHGAAGAAGAGVRLEGRRAEQVRTAEATVVVGQARLEVTRALAAERQAAVTARRDERVRLEGARIVHTRQPASVPPAGWAPQDPADSVWRAGRAAMNRGDFRAAATLFGRIPEQFGRSTYAADAYYWEAFALSRLNTVPDLQRARERLHLMRSRFPNASHIADAQVLEVRIDGQLARLGNAAAAARVTATASAASRPPAPAPAPASAPPPARTPPAPAPPARGEVPPAPAGARGAGGTVVPSSQTPNARAATVRGAVRVSASHDLPAHCPDDLDIRMTALNALLQMDPASATPVLRGVLARRDECSAPLRRQAIFLASQKQAADMEEVLLDALRNDPDAEVRTNAIFYLSRSTSDRAVNALLDVLRTSPERGSQEAALFALSQQRAPRAVEALRAYATRADVPVDLRRNAVFMLGSVDAPGQNEFLRELYARNPDRAMREVVLHSIAQRKGEGNDAWLLGIAMRDGENIELRRTALFVASQDGTVPARELIGLYDRVSDAGMRQHILFMLSQRTEPEAVDKLMDVARNDRSMETRRHALFLLSQSRDPRVARFLAEMVGGG